MEHNEATNASNKVPYWVYYEEQEDDVEYLYEKGNSTTKTRQTQKPTNQQGRIQSEYDDNHYALANPNNCKTKQFGVMKDKIDENKGPTKETSKKAKRKILGATLFVVLIVGAITAYFVYRVQGTVPIPYNKLQCYKSDLSFHIPFKPNLIYKNRHK